MLEPVRLIILGKQGAGKGTLATTLSRRLDIPHISTGDLFREAVKAGTALGDKVASYLDAGELVPVEVVIDVVTDRVMQPDALCRGYLLDGFPRSVYQAESFDVAAGDQAIHAALNLDVSTVVAIRRIGTRRVCPVCGTTVAADDVAVDQVPCPNGDGQAVRRADDTELAIRRRLTIWEEETGPLLSYYAATDRLVTLDAEQEPDVIATEAVEAVAEALQVPVDSVSSAVAD